MTLAGIAFLVLLELLTNPGVAKGMGLLLGGHL